MAVKIKKDLRRLKKLVKRVQKEFARTAPKKIKIAIIDRTILRGISPVKGEGKFQKYSTGYKESIRAGRLPVPKNISPVNLKLSFTMLKSFFTKFKFGRNPRIEIGFNDELADIHNRRGAGKSKVIRRMLPTETGEEFNRSITSTIIKELQKAIKKVVAKTNR